MLGVFLQGLYVLDFDESPSVGVLVLDRKERFVVRVGLHEPELHKDPTVVAQQPDKMLPFDLTASSLNRRLLMSGTSSPGPDEVGPCLRLVVRFPPRRFCARDPGTPPEYVSNAPGTYPRFGVGSCRGT